MMSNLAAELKQHAVTLYEVGKIPHESLDAFLAAAADVAGGARDVHGERLEAVSECQRVKCEENKLADSGSPHLLYHGTVQP